MFNPKGGYAPCDMHPWTRLVVGIDKLPDGRQYSEPTNCYKEESGPVQKMDQVVNILEVSSNERQSFLPLGKLIW